MTTMIVGFTLCLLAIVFADVFVNTFFFLIKSITWLIKGLLFVFSLVFLGACGFYTVVHLLT